MSALSSRSSTPFAPSPPVQYEIFTAATWEQLQTQPDAARWCGLAHFTSPDTCAFTLSPFEDVYVAIKTKRASLLGISESFVWLGAVGVGCGENAATAVEQRSAFCVQHSAWIGSNNSLLTAHHPSLHQ